MNAKGILVRHSRSNPALALFTLEVYLTGTTGAFLTMHTSLAADAVALAKLLKCPISLWQYNPEVVDDTVRKFAADQGVEIVESIP